MYYNLTKKEKKIAAQIIEKGVQADFKAGLEKAKKVITDWENEKTDNRAAYHKLYKTITSHDKKISKRYHGLGGSDYLMTVAVILFEEQITEEDIKDFSDEAKQFIYRWISVWKED